MADTEKPTAKEEQPSLPDFYTNPNAVLGDASATWRYGKPPDYSTTRKVFAETKSKNHETGSLAQLVENLVKNWEVEASFKTNLAEWRTINHERYTFAMNGGPTQTGDDMLRVGTYNAIIVPNEYYSPKNSDFASSHKTFKRMMPTFAWEVLEVYSGPPKVAFRWRHWGVMKNDYVGFNNVEEKITAKAHGGLIDIQGVTVADLDDEMKIVHLETWFDPIDMFRQIAPHGIVNKVPLDSRSRNHLVEGDDSTEDHGTSAQDQGISTHHDASTTQQTSSVQGDHALTEADLVSKLQAIPEHQNVGIGEPAGLVRDHAENQELSSAGPTSGQSLTLDKLHIQEQDVNDKIEGVAAPEASTGEKLGEDKTRGADDVHPTTQQKDQDVEDVVKPSAGEAVAASGASEEARRAHEEMSRITPAECPALMNRE